MILALGDSIALGAGHALHAETIAHVGASSCAILGHTPSGEYDVVVISAGINDPPGRCVASIRDRVHARKIIWVLPAPISSARSTVAAVAAAHGDQTVGYACAGGCTRNNFHPGSYERLAADILKELH